MMIAQICPSISPAFSRQPPPARTKVRCIPREKTVSFLIFTRPSLPARHRAQVSREERSQDTERGTTMIIIVIMALVVLMYFFGLQALYYTGGLFAAFYVCAVVAARRSAAGGSRRGLPAERAPREESQSEPAC